MAIVGERKPAGMPEHVRMRLEGEPGGFSHSLNHARKPCDTEGSTALAREHERRPRLLLALQLA
jgi:hypothetical protein